MADGSRTRWREALAVLGDRSTVHLPTVPTLFVREGVGVLTAQVWYQVGESEPTEIVGLQGRFVEGVGSGLRASAATFSAVAGVGVVQDPHDGVEIDRDDGVVPHDVAVEGVVR